ncbi:hypothetical protein [Sporolactobacillus pectinivorans]|uniref:hypothetical protein n=1 Tax=Sporolactobacillus pectinivorans TaxID=1591408 RepID=UPI000C25C52A|nr:hypothetical protein [Sporolactobacillus pectinivorans]
MKKMIATITVLVLVLTACANQQDQSYGKYMKQGQQAISSENYAAAEKYIDKALSSKKDDQKATVLLSQLSEIKTVTQGLKSGDYETAIKAANAILVKKGGSGVLIMRARELKNFAETARQKQLTSGSEQSQSSESSSQPAPDSQVSSNNNSSSPADSSTSSGSDSVASGSNASSGSSSPQASGSGTDEPAGQHQAEATVAKAAGYSLSQVYADTTDNGAYYSIELRENHSGDSATDPNTAPSIGFFRYYKNTGRITQLDIISNQYKDVKN